MYTADTLTNVQSVPATPDAKVVVILEDLELGAGANETPIANTDIVSSLARDTVEVVARIKLGTLCGVPTGSELC